MIRLLIRFWPILAASVALFFLLGGWDWFKAWIKDSKPAPKRRRPTLTRREKVFAGLLFLWLTIFIIAVSWE